MRPRTLLVWVMGVAAAALMLAYATAVLPSKAHEGHSAPPAAVVSVPVRRAAPVAALLPAPSAGPTAPAVATRRVKGADTMPGHAGMVVGIDPETGQLGMPTAEQMVELSAPEQSMVNHSGEGLVERHHADGSVSIDLQGRFQEFAVVRIGPDGKPVVGCVDDAKTLRRALQPGPPAPALEVK